MLIHEKVLRKDLKKCIKKRWYPKLDQELPRVLKLLHTCKNLPGQYAMRDFQGNLSGKVWHASIKLPGMGKLEGARIAYALSSGIKILYLGGHKDRVYNDSKEIANLITARHNEKEESFMKYSTYIAALKK